METEHSKDDIKLSVKKSSSQDQKVSPRCRPSMSNLVYVRRKHETQSGKTRTSNNEEGASGHSQSEQVVDHCMATITNTKQQQQPLEIEPVNTDYSKPTSVLVPCNTPSSDAPSAPISLVKHSNGLSLGVNVASPGSKQYRGIDESHWREQFTRLQAYLESCDNSNQEAYTNLLRSSTPSERSRLAVELEKRAIRLVMEEGREMERVKALNILGNSKSEQ